MLPFADRLSPILSLVTEAEDKGSFKNAVAIVKMDDYWLLGFSRARDHRHHKWCFPGGGIHSGESCFRAAPRECKEETGVEVRSVGGVFSLKKYEGVAFVPCKASQRNPKIIVDLDEFAAMGWYKEREFDSLKLHDDVRECISRAKRYY